MSAGGLRRGQKPPYRVQFLGADDGAPENGNPSVGMSEIPQIHLPDPDGDDIGDVPLPSPHWTLRTNTAAISAQDRAKRLESKLISPVSASRRNSATPEDYFSSKSAQVSMRPYESPPLQPLIDHPVRLDDIPLQSMENPTNRPYDINNDTTDDDSDYEVRHTLQPSTYDENAQEARRLVRSLTNGMGFTHPRPSNLQSGTSTPAVDRRLQSSLHETEYVPVPDEYKPSVLSSILFSKLAQYQASQTSSSSSDSVANHKPRRPASVKKSTRSPPAIDNYSGPSSGRATPSGRKPRWYDQSPSRSGSFSAAPTLSGSPQRLSARPPDFRRKSSGMIAAAVDLIKHPKSAGSRRSSATNVLNDTILNLELQVSDILARRKYILKLCRALMTFGAPTHRMEEYMITTARKLMIHGSFQYLPNCMIVAFSDSDLHTTEVHLVKEVAAIDLGKFQDVFDVYKNVIHDQYEATEAIAELGEIMNRPKKYPNWALIIIYGIAAIAVGPFAFSARPADFPICFLLGCILGYLQLEVAPNSTQFSHVFEVFACVVVTFAARGFGSIQHQGRPLFCFSAISQSSIALILPGWIILCAAQELQSRNLVAGSIRMVYAIIYTLFLGFGILIGTTLMGLVYPSATSVVTCDVPDWWNPGVNRWRAVYVNFTFVPIFTICLAMVNQARWRQMVPMTIISLAGYTTNYWASLRFAQNVQVANACGAFIIGALANTYSRFFHGLAAAAMLPAIFVQVPSGLAASGSLVAGLTSANQITTNATGSSIVTNGTQGFLDAQNATSASTYTTSGGSAAYSGTIFDVGYGMVQVAIGISVGLFLSALLVYPFNKRRSGLFSF